MRAFYRTPQKSGEALWSYVETVDAGIVNSDIYPIPHKGQYPDAILCHFDLTTTTGSGDFILTGRMGANDTARSARMGFHPGTGDVTALTTAGPYTVVSSATTVTGAILFLPVLTSSEPGAVPVFLSGFRQEITVGLWTAGSLKMWWEYLIK